MWRVEAHIHKHPRTHAHTSTHTHLFLGLLELALLLLDPLDKHLPHLLFLLLQLAHELVPLGLVGLLQTKGYKYAP